MADAYTHAQSSARRFGGKWEDYIEIHRWFDSTKVVWADQRHRAVLHSAFGIGIALQVFGQIIFRKSDNVSVPVRWIGEQHVQEDCGFIPSLQDWLQDLPMKDWMHKGARKFVRTFTLEE
jgi:hypothetical protein